MKRTDFFKKGNAIVDGLFIIVILFILAIIFGISGYVLNTVTPELEPILTDTIANDSLQHTAEYTPSALDGLFVILLALFWMGGIILSFMVDTHPVFFVLTLILLAFIFIIGGYLSNFYVEFSSDMDFRTTYPMMTYIMDKYVQFIIGIVASIMISLFAKSRLT